MKSSRETVLKRKQNYVIFIYKIILLSATESEPYSRNIFSSDHTTSH